MRKAAEAETGRRLLLAFYPNEDSAQGVLDRLVEHDFPLDRVSMLGKASASGDDPLGVYYHNVGERMKGWGRLGAVWGGLFGLLSGAAGLFLVPGLGPVIAAGPAAEALFGAAAGAGLGGGMMAGGAALSQLAVAVHRMGVPDERIEEVEHQLDRGHYLLMLIVDRSEVARWRDELQQGAAGTVWDFPYVTLTKAVSDMVGD